VTSPNLKKCIDEQLTTNSFADKDSDIIVLLVKKEGEGFNICVSFTRYDIFKYYRPDVYEKLVGYSSYRNMPILLFGDLKNPFLKETGIGLQDFLGELPNYTKDFPPIIYEPRMNCEILTP